MAVKVYAVIMQGFVRDGSGGLYWLLGGTQKHKLFLRPAASSAKISLPISILEMVTRQH